MAETTTKPIKTDAELLAEREAEVRKKHRRVIEGTIRRETAGSHAGKLTVEMKCQHPDCEATRRVATSDLFQVRFCQEHTAERRKAKRRKAYKAKKAEAGEPSGAGKKPRKVKEVAEPVAA